MVTLWFCIVAAILAAYATLDGFDLGAGIIYLFVARTDEERRAVLRSIGPVWDGNEVWLIAGGGILFLAFSEPLRRELQRFLFAVNDRAMAPHATRHLTGVSQSALAKARLETFFEQKELIQRSHLLFGDDRIWSNSWVSLLQSLTKATHLISTISPGIASAVTPTAVHAGYSPV